MKRIAGKIGMAAFLCAGMFAGHAYAGSSTLSDYFEMTSGLIPNKLSLSIYEEIVYNDNIHDATKGNERDSLIFKTGIGANINRTVSGLTYGLKGNLSYDYYTKDSGDMNAFDWDISPVLLGNFGLLNMQNLMVIFTSSSSLEPLDTGDTRFARHYENGLHAVYDYSKHEKWGFILTGDYVYDLYTQDEFESYTNHEYGFSLVPYYKLTEKVKTGVRLGYSETKYKNDDTNDDSYTVTINGFVDYRMSQLFSVNLEAGVQKRCYEGESEGSNKDRDFMPDYSITLRYLPFSNLAFDLKSSLSTGDSLTTERGGLALENDTSLTMRWDATSKISITQTVGLNIQDEKNNDADTKEFYYDLLADYAFSKAMSVYAGYKYNNIQFDYRTGDDYYVNECRLGFRWSF